LLGLVTIGLTENYTIWSIRIW